MGTPCAKKTKSTATTMRTLRCVGRLGRSRILRLFSTTGSEQILLESASDVSILTLNRPKANAMGRQFLGELRSALDQCQDTRCLVLTSHSHKVFSAGADLKERATMTQEEAETFVAELRDTMQLVAELPFPVVACIEGVALGGGLELALAADIRVASESATLGLPETSLAIIPGAGGTQRLPRIVGEARAKELIWMGRRLNGREAYGYGMVNAVTDSGMAMEEALAIASKIASHGPIAIRASKESIHRGLEAATMREALEIERSCYAKVLPTNDRLEGLAAFKEGREPVYRGY